MARRLAQKPPRSRTSPRGRGRCRVHALRRVSTTGPAGEALVMDSASLEPELAGPSLDDDGSVAAGPPSLRSVERPALQARQRLTVGSDRDGGPGVAHPE